MQELDEFDLDLRLRGRAVAGPTPQGLYRIRLDAENGNEEEGGFFTLFGETCSTCVAVTCCCLTDPTSGSCVECLPCTCTTCPATGCDYGDGE